VGKKIRNAELQKIPYILVVGDKEMNGGKLAVRERGQKDTVGMSADELIKSIKAK
jgi:threonyl-tRNA synthetase